MPLQDDIHEGTKCFDGEFPRDKHKLSFQSGHTNVQRLIQSSKEAETCFDNNGAGNRLGFNPLYVYFHIF